MGLFSFFRKNKKEEKPQPEPPQNDFTSQLKHNAALCVEQYGDKFKGLNFTTGSLKVIDAILEEASDFFNDMDEKQQMKIISLTGAYIFEVARTNYGGRYSWYAELTQPILVTGQPEFEISLLAFEKVKGRLINGDQDNIPFFFKGYEERVKTAKKGDKAMIV